MEIVGRHHDPFTVMEQFERPRQSSASTRSRSPTSPARCSRGRRGRSRPTTGSFSSRFPLVRGRRVPAGASPGALAAGRGASPRWPSPSPHSIWRTPPTTRMSRRPSGCRSICSRCGAASTTRRRRRWRFSAPSIACVTLSNFYGGLIAAVITPVALAAYWLFKRRAEPASTRRLGVTVGSLVVVAAAWTPSTRGTPPAPSSPNRAAFAFPRARPVPLQREVVELSRSAGRASAARWSRAPRLERGRCARRAARTAGEPRLGHHRARRLVAVCAWLVRHRDPLSPVRSTVARAVPILAIVAAAALVCSLSPERTIGPFTFVRPSALLYPVVPMFRSYARFGVVVQLMAALLAGIGVERLWRSATRRARGSRAWRSWRSPAVRVRRLAARRCGATCCRRWRIDGSPRQTGRVHVLDCAPLTPESESVQWLTGDRIALSTATVRRLPEPNLAR